MSALPGPRLDFRVAGTPAPKERPRVQLFQTSRRGVRERLARPRVYTPANTERFERAVAWEATAALRTARLEPFAGFVRLRVWAFFALSLDGDRPAHEPDADNVLKVVGDALNKVAYRDDRDVADAIAHKRFTVGEPFVRVRVTPLAFDLLEVARGR